MPVGGRVEHHGALVVGVGLFEEDERQLGHQLVGVEHGVGSVGQEVGLHARIGHDGRRSAVTEVERLGAGEHPAATTGDGVGGTTRWSAPAKASASTGMVPEPASTAQVSVVGCSAAKDRALRRRCRTRSEPRPASTRADVFLDGHERLRQDLAVAQRRERRHLGGDRVVAGDRGRPQRLEAVGTRGDRDRHVGSRRQSRCRRRQRGDRGRGGGRGRPVGSGRRRGQTQRKDPGEVELLDRRIA